MDILRNVLLGWFMFLLIPLGPGLGMALARHYHLNEFFWTMIGMPLGLSVILVGSSATIVRMNNG